MLRVANAYAAKANPDAGVFVPSSMKSATRVANLFTLLTVSLACIFDPLLRL